LRSASLLTIVLVSAGGFSLAQSNSEQATAINSNARWTRIEESREIGSTPWDLSEAELTRAKSLLQGVRGAVSDVRISPIEVLGIHAESDAERHRYAEQWAKLQIADAERVLAFERAYRSAVRKLLNNRALIDRGALPTTKPTATLQPGDRLLFFTRTDCAACEALQSRVLKQAGRLAGIDIYLTDQSSAAAIRHWAREQGIDPIRVQAKQVTLNADDGLLDRLSEHSVKAPYLLRQRGTSLTPVVLLDGP
jgi:integrating conjugative element protein (TIGR03759 family)